jgi:hypothetical protein
MTPTNIYNFNNAVAPMNTGPMSVFYELGTIYKVIFIPKGKMFTTTEMLTPYATLDALCKNNTIALRAFPIGDFIDFQDKSTAEVTATTGYGYMQYITDGKPVWEFIWDQGGMSFEKVMKSFQGLQNSYDLLVIDRDANVILGTDPATTGYALKGFSLEMIYSTLIKTNNAKEKTRHSTVIALKDAKELVERHVAIQLDPTQYPVYNLQGLYNFELSLVPSSFTTTSAKLKITTGDKHLDLYDLYSAALVTATASIWSAVTDSTGVALSVSTIAANSATKAMTLTFGTSTAAGATVTITSPTVSALTAAGLTGFAGSTLQITAV